jgi:predicted phage tail protein
LNLLRSTILLVTIKPHSSLQTHFIGDNISIHLNSYKELLNYLQVMQPRFMLYTKQLMAEGIQESFVFLDEQLNELSSEDLFIKRFSSNTTVYIVPLVMGGGGKRGGLLAILASAALFFFAGPLGAFIDPFISSAAAEAGITGASVVTQLATGLAISGLSALLMKSPISSKDSEKSRIENAMFASLRNTVDSGTFVPINYGQVRVAGQLITGYVKTVNHPKGFNVKVSDVLGFNNVYYDSLLAAQSGFLPLPTSIEVLTRDGLIMYIDAGNKRSYPGAGSVVSDLISGQEGTLLGSVVLEESYFKLVSGSIDMNKTYIGTEEINNDNKAYTFETWVNLSNSISNANVITNTACGIAVDKEIITNTVYEFSDDSPTTITTVSPKFKSINTTPVIQRNGTMDRWQHVALAVSKNAARLYINGVFNTTGTTSVDITGASNLIIGSTQLTEAKIAIARVYNRTLTEDEIIKNFKAEKNRFGL